MTTGSFTTDRNVSGIPIAAALFGMALFGLAACDNGPSAVQTRDRSPEAAPASQPLAALPSEAETAAVLPEAKPPITGNRRETVSDKTQRLYERNGADFGAKSPADYIAKVQAFTDRPPAGADSVKRPNGDTLYYHAASNTFAVVARDGTPRTMFKPRDGARYWADQKAKAPTFGQRRER